MDKKAEALAKQIEDVLHSTLQGYVGAPRDIHTCNRLLAAVKDTVEHALEKHDNLQIICDESNNPLESVQRGMIHMEIIGKAKIKGITPTKKEEAKNGLTGVHGFVSKYWKCKECGSDVYLSSFRTENSGFDYCVQCMHPECWYHNPITFNDDQDEPEWVTYKTV